MHWPRVQSAPGVAQSSTVAQLSLQDVSSSQTRPSGHGADSPGTQMPSSHWSVTRALSWQRVAEQIVPAG